MRKEGFDEAKARLRRLSSHAAETLDRANRENGEELVATAKVLIPARSGASRSMISGLALAPRRYLVTFAPLSRILEGGTEERTTKAGESRGRGPARPHVNPALRATLKRRRARFLRALREAIRHG